MKKKKKSGLVFVVLGANAADKTDTHLNSESRAQGV